MSGIGIFKTINFPSKIITCYDSTPSIKFSRKYCIYIQISGVYKLLPYNPSNQNIPSWSFTNQIQNKKFIVSVFRTKREYYLSLTIETFRNRPGTPSS